MRGGSATGESGAPLMPSDSLLAGLGPTLDRIGPTAPCRHGTHRDWEQPPSSYSPDCDASSRQVDSSCTICFARSISFAGPCTTTR